MSCCGGAKRNVKNVIRTGKNIVVGYTNYIRKKKYEFTDGRIRVCQKCEKNYWIGKSLWCSMCKCFIPAKARVKENTCPLEKWTK